MSVPVMALVTQFFTLRTYEAVGVARSVAGVDALRDLGIVGQVFGRLTHQEHLGW